tara:strand:+ start:538 stop:813 length:276 start_codon:yes stop_codon:yes gene_type:complete
MNTINIVEEYGKDIQKREATPKEAALVYVMEEIRRAGSHLSDQVTNKHQKKFVIALAKFHNQIAKDFKGDWEPMDIDLIGKYIDQQMNEQS